MNISGKTIMKGCAVVLAGLFGTAVYFEYKELREEEQEKKRHFEETFPDDEYAEMDTSECLVKAVKKTGKDFVESVISDPLDFLKGAAIGGLAGLCYIAGTNDGAEKLRDVAICAINDAKIDGILLGFAGGRKQTRDHVRISNPETGETIISNLNIYEHLHHGSDAMKFRTDKLLDDPDIRADYENMKSNMREVEEETA